MIAPSTRRRAVVPSAPTSGNRFLAREAPLWIETMATASRAMGTRRAVRGMKCPTRLKLVGRGMRERGGCLHLLLGIIAGPVVEASVSAILGYIEHSERRCRLVACLTPG